MTSFIIEYKTKGFDYISQENNYEQVFVEPVTEPGMVELSDQEVDALVLLMRERKSSDVDEIGLATVYPDIYKKLYQAYYVVGVEAEEKYELLSTFLTGEYLGAFNDYRDELVEYCKANCGFKFELDEKELQGTNREQKNHLEQSAFDKWLEDYVRSLSLKEMKKFLHEHMHIVSDTPHFEPTVRIPQAIIDMAHINKEY